MGTEDIEQVALVGPIQLPVVDMSAKCLSDPEKRRYETEKLLASFTESGFCLVTGIDGYHEEELLKWTKWWVCHIFWIIIPFLGIDPPGHEQIGGH